MHWEEGISAVTLKGGRTYHRLIPAEEGEHAIRWFLYDPMAVHVVGASRNLPVGWLDSILSGLKRVNPFINELENLTVSAAVPEDDELALHLDQPEHITCDEITAIVLLSPASEPNRQKIIIHRTGETEHRFLDLLSPYVEPLHYLLLLPYGTLGWSPNRTMANGCKFSQMRWYRTRIFMNAEQMSIFSCLTGPLCIHISSVKLS
jgi:hypothetical protein